MSDPRETELQRQLEQLRSENARLQQENKLLREKLDALARRIFGRSSEQLSENQLLLLWQEAATPGPALGKGSSPEVIETEPAARKKVSKAARRPRVPEDLPVLEVVLVPEAVQAEPAAWQRMGEEVSNQLDY